jgi:hypothetical protein
MIRTSLKSLARACAVAAALVVSSLALAEGGLLTNLSFSVTSPDYAKELGITDSQRSQIEKAMRSYSGDQQALSKRATSEEAFDKLDAEYAEKILGFLTPAQKSRLKQIALQEEGPVAIARTEIAQELGLSAEQRSKIVALATSSKQKQEDLDTKIGEKLASIPAPTARTKAAIMAYENKKNAAYASFDDEQKKLDAVTADNDSKIIATLTAAQKAKWLQMLGKKFSV